MQAVVWSKGNCPFCVKAKALLDQRGIEYEERIIDNGWTKEQLLEAVPNARSVPQVFVRGRYVGGYNELVEYIEQTNLGSTEGRIG